MDIMKGMGDVVRPELHIGGCCQECPRPASGPVIHWKDSQNSLKFIILKITVHYNEKMNTD